MALFRRPALIDPRVVPTEDVEIDWGHPLAVGLVACYLPGVSLRDLAGVGPTLLADSGAAITTTPRGPALRSTVSRGRAYVTGIPQSWQLAVAGTLFWAGDITGTPVNGATFWGNNYDSVSSSPYVSYNAGINGSNQVAFFWNSGGSFQHPASSGPSVNSSLRSVAMMFVVGGNMIGYANGGQIISTAFGASAPSYTSTTTANIGGDNNDPSRNIGGNSAIALTYNRALSAGESAWLDAEPFAMLRPRAPMRTWSFPSVSPGITVDFSATVALATFAGGVNLVVSAALSRASQNVSVASGVSVATAANGSVVLSAPGLDGYTDNPASTIDADFSASTSTATLSGALGSVITLTVSATLVKASLVGALSTTRDFSLTAALSPATLAGSAATAGEVSASAQTALVLLYALVDTGGPAPASARVRKRERFNQRKRLS